MPRLLTEACSDGLLIDYTHAIPPALLALIERHRIPAVWINSRQPLDCVRPDDEAAGYDATRRLLERGTAASPTPTSSTPPSGRSRTTA